MKPPSQTNTSKEIRDSGYPIYPLDEALKFALAVVELGGARNPVSKSLLAKHMKYAETGPSFVQRLGAARCFGLIQGRGEYTLTEIARQYFYPTSETAKSAAAYQFLKQPKPFEIITEKFRGLKLPPNEIIGNILHSEAGVPLSWKDRSAVIFIKSAKAIGAVNEAGILKPDEAYRSGMPERVEEKEILAAITPPTDSSNQKHEAEEENSLQTQTHTIFLDKTKRRKLTVSAPLDVTNAELQRVKGWLEFALLVEKTADGGDPSA